jgi:hypothetical protein
MDMLTSLPCAQYAGVSSLRELENGLAIFRGETNHTGLNYRPGLSTLATPTGMVITYTVFERIFHEPGRVRRKNLRRFTIWKTPGLAGHRIYLRRVRQLGRIYPGINARRAGYHGQHAPGSGAALRFFGEGVPEDLAAGSGLAEAVALVEMSLE